jgi:ribonuclease HI
MELQAVIKGLEALNRATIVEVITDSAYVAKGATEWIRSWKANNWRRKEKNRWAPVKNVELWQTLDALLAKHRVRFTTILGHSGHVENERCDELAVAAALKYSK